MRTGVSGNVFTKVASPVGELMLVAEGGSLIGLHFENPRYEPRLPSDCRRDDDVFTPVVSLLDAYFAGEAVDFEVSMKFEGTLFQRRVWEALRTIPHGTTVSYADVAGRIGAPKAVRAVGAAVGRNPIAIIVPCHRVIGANGDLTGFGGGLDRKRHLLALEGGLPARRGARLAAMSV